MPSNSTDESTPTKDLGSVSEINEKKRKYEELKSDINSQDQDTQIEPAITQEPAKKILRVNEDIRCTK